MNVNIIGTQYFPKCRVSTKSRLTKEYKKIKDETIEKFIIDVKNEVDIDYNYNKKDDDKRETWSGKFDVILFILCLSR